MERLMHANLGDDGVHFFPIVSGVGQRLPSPTKVVSR